MRFDFTYLTSAWYSVDRVYMFSKMCDVCLKMTLLLWRIRSLVSDKLQQNTLMIRFFFRRWSPFLKCHSRVIWEKVVRDVLKSDARRKIMTTCKDLQWYKRTLDDLPLETVVTKNLVVACIEQTETPRSFQFSVEKPVNLEKISHCFHTYMKAAEAYQHCEGLDWTQPAATLEACPRDPMALLPFFTNFVHWHVPASSSLKLFDIKDLNLLPFTLQPPTLSYLTTLSFFND